MAECEDEAYGSDVTEEYSEDNDKVSYESEMKPSDSDIPSTETLKQMAETDIRCLDTYLFDNATQGFEALANNEMAQGGGPQTTSPIIPDNEMKGSAGARAILQEASPSHYFRPATPVEHGNTMFPSPTGTPGRAGTVQSPGRGRPSMTIYPPSPRASPTGGRARVTVYTSPGRGSQQSSPSPGGITSPFVSPTPSPKQYSQLSPSHGRGTANRGTSTRGGRARGGRGQTPRGGRGTTLSSPPSATGFSAELTQMLLKGSKPLTAGLDSYKSPQPVVRSPAPVQIQQSPVQPRGGRARGRGQATKGGGRGGRGGTRGPPKQVTTKATPGRQLGPRTSQPVSQKTALSSELTSMLQGSSSLLGAMQQRPQQVQQTPQHVPEVKSSVSEQLQEALKGSQAMQAISGGLPVPGVPRSSHPVAIVQPRGRNKPEVKSDPNPTRGHVNPSGSEDGLVKTEQSGKPPNGNAQELIDSEPKVKLPPIDVFMNSEVTDFKLPPGVSKEAEDLGETEVDDAADDEEEETAGSGNAEGEREKKKGSKTSAGKKSSRKPQARKGTKRKKDDEDLDDDQEYYGDEDDDNDDDDYLPGDGDDMVEKDEVPKTKKPPARKRTRRVKEEDADYLQRERNTVGGNGKVVTAEIHQEPELFSDDEMASTESKTPDQKPKNTKPKPGPKSRKVKANSKTKKDIGEEINDATEEGIQDVQGIVEQPKPGEEHDEQPVERKRGSKQSETRNNEISEAQNGDNDDEQEEDHSQLRGDAIESQESEPSKSPAGKKKTTSKKTPAKAKKNTPATKKAAEDERKKLESTMKNVQVHISVFKCCNCNETFASKGELAKHDAERHPQMFECKKCRAVFIDEEAFLKHDGECDVNLAEDQMEVDESSEKTNNFACKECEEKFEDRIGLERHLMTHGDEASFACTACLQKFTTEEEMEQHMNEDHNPDE